MIETSSQTFKAMQLQYFKPAMNKKQQLERVFLFSEAAGVVF